MKTKARNKEVKRLWRAELSLDADRKYGFNVRKESRFKTDCGLCGSRVKGYEYVGTVFSLSVADCFVCGTTTKEVGHGGRPGRTRDRRAFIYGNKADAIMRELERAVV